MCKCSGWIALSSCVQSHVECLSEESREKDGELERVVSRRDDLEGEVASLRKDLQTAQQNVTILETEVCVCVCVCVCVMYIYTVCMASSPAPFQIFRIFLECEKHWNGWGQPYDFT